MRLCSRAVMTPAIAIVLLLAAGGCGQSSGTSSSLPTTSPTTSATSGPATSTTSATAVSPTVPYASTTLPSAPTSTSVSSGTVVSIPEAGLEYTRLPGDERVVALTFDGAYEVEPLTDILAALDAHDAPATFFVTGEFAEEFPEAVRAMVASGRPIGNHSYSHPDFTALSDSDITGQLERTAALLVEAGADDPRPLFRFPYGARDTRTRAAVGRAGYVSVYWTVDTLDWKPERSAESIKDDVLGKATPGAIFLMHVGSGQTASVLSAVLDGLDDAGYGFVDLRSVLGGGGH